MSGRQRLEAHFDLGVPKQLGHPPGELCHEQLWYTLPMAACAGDLVGLRGSLGLMAWPVMDIGGACEESATPACWKQARAFRFVTGCVDLPSQEMGLLDARSCVADLVTYNTLIDGAGLLCKLARFATIRFISGMNSHWSLSNEARSLWFTFLARQLVLFCFEVFARLSSSSLEADEISFGAGCS